MVAECYACFGKRGLTGRPRQKLDTKLRFKLDQPTADDGF
jgi:hypothetical protein